MTATPSVSTDKPIHPAWLIGTIVVVGVALRVTVIALWPEKLLEDTDAYLAYAKAWSETGTFGYEGQPTAYRPPVYPWLLSLFGPPTAAWVALINLLSGAGTILLVWLTARRMRMTTIAAAIAASLIALDPLLVQYCGQAMTESLCTFESALLLWLIANAEPLRDSGSIHPPTTRGVQALWCRGLGLVLGFSILTRPTFLVFGMFLAAAVLLIRVMRSQRQSWWPLIFFILWTLFPVTCWGVRNYKYLGSPIITTTHGGYTLLLGNNDDYYKEVIEAGHSTEWPGVEDWSQRLNRALADHTEVERDTMMRDGAIDTIRREPGLFLRACIRRIWAFWAIQPSGEARAGVPRVVLISAAVFYTVWWLLSAAGYYHAARNRAVSLLPAACLIVSFAALHIVYWSNARMRAPVLPALAIFAAYGLWWSLPRRYRKQPAAPAVAPVAGETKS